MSRERNDTDSAGIPAVGGDRIDCSIATLERRFLIALKDEQEKPSPDNSLIALFCDGVRLGREYCNAMKTPIARVTDRASGVAEKGLRDLEIDVAMERMTIGEALRLAAAPARQEEEQEELRDETLMPQSER